MAFKLSEWSLISIRDSVEQGFTQDVSCLTPKMRNQVLDMILMHGTVAKSSCLQALGSPEFFHGLTSLDLHHMNIDDHKYMDLVSQSLATQLPNGNSVGTGIKEIKLNLYGYYRPELLLHGDEEQDEKQMLYMVNYKCVLGLIAQCPSLQSLDLHFIEIGNASAPGAFYSTKEKAIKAAQTAASIGYDTVVENGTDLFNGESLISCLSVIRNLRRLSVRSHCIKVALPYNELKQLTALRLVDCRMDPDDWNKLESSIREHIQYLELDVNFVTEVTILQAPFPQLKALILDLSHETVCFQHLRACPNLVRVHMKMYHGCMSQEDMEVLNQIKAHVTIGMYTSEWIGNIHRYRQDFMQRPLYEQSRFRVISSFGDKVTQLDLIQMFEWDSQLVTALEHALSVCHNLERLALSPSFLEENSPQNREFWWKKAMHALRGHFASQEKALKLRYFDFAGDIDIHTLNALFDNCINIETLEISDCPQLTDAHFTEWARRGATPSIIKISDCQNLTANGLIPVLIASGERLTRLSIKFSDSDDEVRKRKIEAVCKPLWPVLATYCRRVELVTDNEYPMCIKCDPSVRSKFYRKLIVHDEYEDAFLQTMPSLNYVRIDLSSFQ